jgi:hypothetical protein
MEPKAASKRFAFEFLTATAVFVVCLLWIFRAPLLSGQVAAFEAKPQSSGALLDIRESVYEVEAPLVVQARMLKDGFFPSWTPYSAGGNPLIAKMQNAVFAPEHLLLYVFPLASFPYLLMAIVALKLYLAFIFTYLFARTIRLDQFAAIFAGLIYVFSDWITFSIAGHGSAASYLPLLLLLVESYFRGHRRRAQWLLPWAVAFTFLAGHFESAFYICMTTGIYFLARLSNDASAARGEKFARLLGFVGPASVGAILAGVQIAPAYEYVQHSYNKAWHDSSFWGFWDYQTIAKHLSFDDSPMLGLGFTGLFLFVWSLKSYFQSREKPPHVRLLALVGAAASLATCIACLSNLGLDETLSRLACCFNTADLLSWVAGFFLLFLSFWIWRADDQHPGIKILGGIMIGSIALMLRLPLLSNALLHLPLFKDFHNAGGHRWEFNLATAILCAAALQKIHALAREAWPRRFKIALRSFCVLIALVGGYLTSLPLKEIAARLIPAGIPAIDSQHAPPGAAGGIMGPQTQVTYGRTRAIVGWVPASPKVASIAVELAQAGQPLSPSHVMAEISSGSDRRYFHAIVPVPTQLGNKFPAALVTYADGAQKMLQGGEVEVRARGKSPESAWLIVGAVLAFPLIFLSGTVVPRVAAALLLIWMMGQCPSDAIPASQRPYRLGGVDKIKEDKEPLRIGSLQTNFLTADYPSVYGISDIRPGGDNIDVLSHIYFNFVGGAFLGNTSDSGGLDLHHAQNRENYDEGLRLFGIANVKYFVDFPDSTLTHPDLEPIYRGSDMTVFRNKQFRPRAQFYSRYTYLSMGDWTDYGKRDNFILPLLGQVRQGVFNDGSVLLLNDMPTESFEIPAQAAPTEASVVIKDYSPDKVRIDVAAARPGLLFLADTLFPGWVASRNGVEVPILRSWLNFRAVQVPAGKSTVEFAYRPVVLLTALFASVLAALAWLILYYRDRFGHSPHPESSLPAARNKKKKKSAEPDPFVLDEDVVMIGLCIASAERIELSLIAATLLFWTIWAALRYKGGIQHGWASGGWEINAAAGALLVIGAAIFFRDLKKRAFGEEAGVPGM